jgi:predicted helicase
MMKGIRLYDYQQDMKQRIEEAFRSRQSMMVRMPTGTGKTYLLAAVVSDLMARTPGKGWIVAHLKWLPSLNFFCFQLQNYLAPISKMLNFVTVLSLLINSYLEKITSYCGQTRFNVERGIDGDETGQ